LGLSAKILRNPLRNVRGSLLKEPKIILTVNRYSTARSGLKKAARIASSIWALSKPMLSMFAIASASIDPLTPAGDGVDGTTAIGAAVDWDGAAGGAGVAAAAGAGVDGTAFEDDAAVALGWGFVSFCLSKI